MEIIVGLFFAILLLVGMALAGFGIYCIVRKARGKDAVEDGVESVFARMINGVFFRALVVAGITLLLLIPLAFVDNIVDERWDFHREAINKIAHLWGQPQTISGPVLAVPYEVWREVRETVTTDDGKTITVPRRYRQGAVRIFLPKTVHFFSVLEPKTLHQGIYDSVVYTSPLAVSGEFRLMPEAEFDDNLAAVHWDKAWMAVGIRDVKALSTEKRMTWNGADIETFSPGTNLDGLLGAGFHIKTPVQPGRPTQGFLLTLSLQGSGGILFTPVGETTAITITGAWNAPSFTGDLSPQTRMIANNGFTAGWSIPNLSRTYPQSGVLGSGAFSGDDSERSITSFVSGVNLYETVSLYRLATRAVKYGGLFIGLTFIALMCFELSSAGRGARLHFMQYALVGVAMSLFYLVLLSLAEQSSFALAFTAASAISVLMNGLYIMAAMRSLPRGLTVMALLAGLYAVLYALLKMEDYALLMGTALVLIVLGVLMYLTRNLPAAGKTGAGTGTS